MKKIFVLLHYIFPESAKDDEKIAPKVIAQSTKRSWLRRLMSDKPATKNIYETETYDIEHNDYTETLKGGTNSRGMNIWRLIPKEKMKGDD